MNQVEEFKNFWMMHEPVCPVEISIVNDEHQRECSIKIKPPILPDFCVMRSERLNGRVFNKKQRNKSKEQHGDDGITNFTDVMFCLRKLRLNFFMPEPFA